jgi:hypothetical protein
MSLNRPPYYFDACCNTVDWGRSAHRLTAAP